jgi:hypothetical protein
MTVRSRKVARWIVVSSFGNPRRVTGVCLNAIDLWETCVDRSSTSGESTLGESECGEVETPEARRDEVICSIDLSIDHRLRVKALWEKASVERLKLPKPEEPK